jgi:transcriptional regulator with XRE-family HTH domain
MFGKFIRKRRLDLGLSLRAFCMKYSEDPSNWSKMEREVLGPPTDYARLLQIAHYLELSDESSKRELFDLAAAERGRVPGDIMSDAQLVENLPVVFRTLRGEAPTEEELVKLADLIRKSRTPQ